MVLLDHIQDLPLPFMFLAACAIAAALALAARMVARGLMNMCGIEPGVPVPLNPTVVVATAATFGLLVAFTYAGIWADTTQARSAVQREAQALENVLVLSAAAPQALREDVRRQVQAYIHQARTVDWPQMAKRTSLDSSAYDGSDTILDMLLERVSHMLAEHPTPLMTAALGQLIELRNARVARLSLAANGTTGSQWFGLLLLAFCALLAVAVTHIHEPRMMMLATGLYGLVVGASFFIVLAHDRPFVGEVSVQPIALVRLLPLATMQVTATP